MSAVDRKRRGVNFGGSDHRPPVHRILRTGMVEVTRVGLPCVRHARLGRLLLRCQQVEVGGVAYHVRLPGEDEQRNLRAARRTSEQAPDTEHGGYNSGTSHSKIL